MTKAERRKSLHEKCTDLSGHYCSFGHWPRCPGIHLLVHSLNFYEITTRNQTSCQISVGESGDPQVLKKEVPDQYVVREWSQKWHIKGMPNLRLEVTALEMKGDKDCYNFSGSFEFF